MTTLTGAVDEFLSKHRIAVAGVSRDSREPANLVYRRHRDPGHEVFPVNPNADLLEGDRYYHAIEAIRMVWTASSW